MKEQILAQNEIRSSWIKSGEDLRSFFYEEYNEYLEAYEKVLIGADPQELIQEIADLYIVYVQLEEVCEETEDIMEKMIDVFYLCDDMEIDLDKAVPQKLFRNSIKYNVELLDRSGYSIEENIAFSKEVYNAMGGDEMFYQFYMMICHEEATNSQNI